MDYSQIIPLTVLAIKEQQGVIDSLKRELQELKRMVIMNQDNPIQTTNISGEIINTSLAMLYQNTPNPFTEKTIIKYDIDSENFETAQILIFDMTGTLLKSYPINEAGTNQLTINGGELKAGMYIYSLIVNNKEVDSKRMILLK